jgi:hypothetical protein
VKRRVENREVPPPESRETGSGLWECLLGRILHPSLRRLRIVRDKYPYSPLTTTVQGGRESPSSKIPELLLFFGPAELLSQASWDQLVYPLEA